MYHIINYFANFYLFNIFDEFLLKKFNALQKMYFFIVQKYLFSNPFGAQSIQLHTNPQIYVRVIY